MVEAATGEGSDLKGESSGIQRAYTIASYAITIHSISIRAITTYAITIYAVTAYAIMVHARAVCCTSHNYICRNYIYAITNMLPQVAGGTGNSGVGCL